MKQFNIFIQLFSLMCLVGANAFAGDIKVENADGVTIYYVWKNNKTELSVSYPGKVPLTYLDYYNDKVVIPETVTYNGETYPVTSIGDCAFALCHGLSSVTIPNSVTSIGKNAFSGCTDLTSIEIPNSVISISDGAFSQTGLISIEISNSVTSIGSGAFLDCSSLTSVELPDSVTNIGAKAFFGCSGLTSITIPNSVTSIGKEAFSGCSGLTNVTLCCNKIGDWFSGLANIKAIVIGDEVTRIDMQAFKNCTGLTSITFPNSVMTIGQDAFQNCGNIKAVNRIIDIATWCMADPITYGYGNYSNPINQAKEVHLFKDNDSEIIDLVIPDEVTSIRSSAFKKCISIESIIISDSVMSIGDDAFSGCSGLTSVTIPNSVTNIGERTFSGCTGLTSVEIPDSVTSIGNKTFSGCTGLTSITIPNGVTNIGNETFSGCTGLTSITIPNSVTSIDYRVFFGCTSLTSITIGNSVTSIGSSAFSGCSGLTSVTIPNSVTSIGKSAFRDCSGLPSVTIPNSVTSIGDDAFSGCSQLKTVIINSNAIVSKEYSPSLGLVEIFDNQVKEYVIGENVKSIGSYAFSDCTGMTSIEIPNSVTSIGCGAFSGCTGLTSFEIPNSVVNIDNDAFSSCSGLTSINLPSGIEKIGNNVFAGCVRLERVEIHVPSIGSWFSELASLKEVLLGEEVTSIGAKAFSGCSNLTSISLPDNIIGIRNDAFPRSVHLYVNKGTVTLLTIWKIGMISYNKQTEKVLLAPTLSVDTTTQTTATIKILNVDLNDGYTYLFNGEAIKDTIIHYTGIRPETTQQLKFVVSKDEEHYDLTSSFTTRSMNATVHENYEVTASSIRATGSYTEEDAKVIAQRMIINGESVEGNECFASGLNPGRSYTVVNEIDVDYGGETIETYSASRSISPARLQFNIAQPKVISEGNAIVAASVNLDPEEENIGFEWRRTDWTNEFPSNTGQAYLYEGVIEGYIKNLNTDKLWKFRPYYLSDDGTYHYGDWMGLDPTNTSYFEPTVHTYAKISIEGNTALVRGYALAGTDKIKVQGFKYWKTSNNAPHRAPVVPSDAKTIEAIGQQIITATLAALDYNATYHYVAFVTTEDGTTYYGEEQVFKTPEGNSTVKDDVNEDGVVDTQDVLAIYKYMQQSDGSAVPGKYDVNGDGIVDTQDVLEIYKYIQEH